MVFPVYYYKRCHPTFEHATFCFNSSDLLDRILIDHKSIEHYIRVRSTVETRLRDSVFTKHLNTFNPRKEKVFPFENRWITLQPVFQTKDRETLLWVCSVCDTTKSKFGSFIFQALFMHSFFFEAAVMKISS